MYSLGETRIVITMEFFRDSLNISPDRQKTRMLLSSSFSSRSQLVENPDEDLPLCPKKGSKHFRILLVRHAESIANVDKSELTRTADHAIDISERGIEQAREAGRQIKKFYESLDLPEQPHVRLWVSPYKRARETAKYIQEEAGSTITDVREHIFLGEQQFGLFEGVPINEIEKMYALEYQHFQKCISFGGRFWARMPLGESRFDVARRVHDSFGTFQRDADNYSIEDLVIVTHGVTLRAFVMMWLHLTPEWFEAEPNPHNCAIRFIDGTRDMSYIFEGFGEEDGRSKDTSERLHSGNLNEFEDKANNRMISDKHQ